MKTKWVYLYQQVPVVQTALEIVNRIPNMMSNLAKTLNARLRPRPWAKGHIMIRPTQMPLRKKNFILKKKKQTSRTVKLVAWRSFQIFEYF